MYGIFIYIYHKNQPNVGKNAIHGWYGTNMSNDFWWKEHLFQLNMYILQQKNTAIPKKHARLHSVLDAGSTDTSTFSGKLCQPCDLMALDEQNLDTYGQNTSVRHQLMRHVKQLFACSMLIYVFFYIIYFTNVLLNTYIHTLFLMFCLMLFLVVLSPVILLNTSPHPCSIQPTRP